MQIEQAGGDGSSDERVVESRRGGVARRLRRRRWDLAALAGLAVFTTVVWGHSAIGGFAHLRLSSPGDSNSFEFYLGWNVHALLNGLNPFFTSVWYAPTGLDLGNAISIPAVALLVAPVTLLFGTTAAFNVALLLSVFLAAAAVYLLARELFGSVLGATMAGVLTSVSPYLVGHGVGHLNMMWVAGLPFIAFLVARHAHGRLGTRWLVLWTALTVGFSLGSSTELFVTQSGFAILAALIALVMAGRHRRSLLKTFGWSALGGVIGVVLGLPVILAALNSGIPESAGNQPGMYPTDLTNIFFPTYLVSVGDSWVHGIGSTWLGNAAENTAYIPPTLLVLLLIALATRFDRVKHSLLVFIAVVIVCSFGPTLTVAGQRTFPMPWRLAEMLPGLDHALPGRFSAFAFFACALLAASVWATRAVPRWITAVLVLGSVILLVPSTERMAFPMDTEAPAYIADGGWRADIEEGDNVLVLPSGQWGDGSLWQTRTNYAFAMPTGNGGGAIPPPDVFKPVGRELFFKVMDFDWKGQLPSYLKERDVTTILIPDTPGDAAEWKGIIDDIYPGRGRLDGGVWVYAVP